MRRESKKLTYKENKELEDLPERIMELEDELSSLVTEMSAPGYHNQTVEKLKSDAERSQTLQQDIALCYARWEELEQKKKMYELG